MLIDRGYVQASYQPVFRRTEQIQALADPLRQTVSSREMAGEGYEQMMMQNIRSLVERLQHLPHAMLLALFPLPLLRPLLALHQEQSHVA